MATTQSDARTSILFELFPQTPKRSEKRILEIVEAAIKSYATLGIEKTTYATIAKIGKISRPLVQHYFKDKEAIFDLAVKYIRIHFQKMAVSAIEKQKTPQKMLEAYVDSTFDWLEKFPNHTRVWLLFYFYCTADKKSRELNTELTQTGRKRIEAILNAGVAMGAFGCKQPAEAALLIQTMVTGALIAAGTETVDVAAYRQTVRAQCLALAK
jgi:AcrR family transcriptional regulator